jgi:hypothetical protein
VATICEFASTLLARRLGPVSAVDSILSRPPDVDDEEPPADRAVAFNHCNQVTPGSARNETTRVKQRVYLLKGTPGDLVRRYQSDLKNEAAAGGKSH